MKIFKTHIHNEEFFAAVEDNYPWAYQWWFIVPSKKFFNIQEFENLAKKMLDNEKN